MNLRTNTALQTGNPLAVVCLAVTIWALSGILPAYAQTPPELPKAQPTDKQTLVNPFPANKGDAQNKGRGVADFLWGITNGNISYKSPTYSRVPDQLLATAVPGALELDGWGFPRGAYQGGVFTLSPTVDIAPTGAGLPTPLPGDPQVWQGVIGPSTDYTLQGFPGGVYYRAPVIPRPNISPFNYSANPNNKRFVWNLNAINVANTVLNQQVRFQVAVHIPTPPDPQDPGNIENRISDARYVVYYYLNGQPKRKVYTVSQLNGGDITLLNDDGLPAFFPFYTTATNINSLPVQPELGVAFQGVTVDDTTLDAGDNLFVIADGLKLLRSVDVIAATPTVTTPHGGRRAADADPVAPGIQNFAAGTQPLQPPSGSQKQDPLIALPAGTTDILNPVPITRFDFINVPDDPRYDPNAAEYDATQPLETWNVTTTFYGPESLLDPRLLPNPALPPPGYPYPAAPADLPGDRIAPGTPNRPQVPTLDPLTGLPIVNPINPAQAASHTATTADATNNNIFRFNPREEYVTDSPNAVGANFPDDSTNPKVPYFSHMQVLYPKVEFGIDPEIGVPDSEKDGTRTIQLGSIWCLDSMTGAPIWRFPDRSYAPGRARNPISINPRTGRPEPLIPGIAAVDKNLDGVIADDEVFIVPGVVVVDRNNNGIINETEANEVLVVPQATNSGGVFASVTFAPKVLVRGSVRVPVYDENGVISPNDSAPSVPGRYYTRQDPNNPANSFQPVQVGMAFVAASNGVIYAMDAYGNNDNYYYPNADYRVFGTYRPGTTNVFWSFSKRLPARGQPDPDQTDTAIPGTNETVENYYRRLKTKIPATGSFGQAAPVLAYRRDEKDIAEDTDPFDPLENELRLFAGNQNGVLYAMDSKADAGVTGNSTTFTGVLSLPFRKESYQPVIAFTPTPAGDTPVFGPNGVKWWFQARGGINATPAVSLMRNDAGEPDPPLTSPPIPPQAPERNRKGVYFTSLEGRVYSVDWEGPVSRQDHMTAMNYNLGFEAATAGPNVVQTTPEILNDNYLFHNVLPALPNARPDRLEGDIRPRWTFPNLYRDIDPANANRFDDPADFAKNNPDIGINGVGSIRLGEPESTLGPITTSPVLIDFPWTDPLIPGSATKHISYVAIQCTDATRSGIAPTESRVYLLDQAGDRANFLTNTVIRGVGNGRRVFAHPKDRFSPKTLLGECAPAWTYRPVYDWYNNTTPTNTGTRNGDRRNSPWGIGADAHPPLNSVELATNQNAGLPGKRIVPTLFIGGIGRLYAIDFDPETGLFARWRSTADATRRITALPNWSPLRTGDTEGDLFPGPEAARDILLPVDPILDPATPSNPVQRTNLRDRRLLVRTIKMAGPLTGITNITISGGPVQNRSTLVDYLPPNGNAVTPPNPSVPGLPTNDAPNLRPLVLDPTQQAANFDESGNRGNQDVNDSISTTEGQRGSGGAVTDPVNRVPNTAYQYPMIYVTDENDILRSISANTEGEDYDTDSATLGQSATVGWGLLYVNPDRFSVNQQLHFAIIGAGGSAGVAVVTDAYFPALSPTFANADRAAANPADPFRFYQDGEPNTTSPTPYRDVAGTLDPTPIPLANNDDPRPDFRPRSFSPGRATLPIVEADRHTGQSGFPLDLNGLFFDKRYAGKHDPAFTAPNPMNNGLYDIANPTNPVPAPNSQKNTIPGQHPNGNFNVRLRLPGYSYIGGHANPLDPFDNVDAADTNNQVPNGAQSNVQNGNTLGDDINPSGQNVCWVFAGGQDGVLKAYTPAMQGQGSGLVAGIFAGVGLNGDSRSGNAAIAIVDEATYNQIVNDGQLDGRLADNTPAVLRAASIARTGGRNFYEYGESVYIVIYDLLAQTQTTGEPAYVFDQDAYIAFGPGGDNSVRLTIRSLNNNAPVANPPPLSLVRQGNGAKPAFYYQVPGNPLYEANPADPAFADPANPTPFGVAVYKLTLGNPNQTSPQVPGDVIEITPQQTVNQPLGARPIVNWAPPSGAGANDVEQNNNPLADNVFSIANPLGVQGFLRQTVPDPAAGPTLPVGATKNAVGDTQNGIGPFQAEVNQRNGTKTELADGSGALTPGTTDPDKTVFDYSQALTNGNTVIRRDLRRFIANPAGNIPPTIINPRFNTILQEGTGANRVDDATYYFPVVASAGYINHGENGSTDTGTNQQNLRLVNRSLRATIPNVRAMPEDFILWRSWPGRVPNAQANLYDELGNVTDDTDNPRFTPPGMDANGRMNILPWETGVNENRPWNPTALPNFSPDYSNIPARSEKSVRVLTNGGNMTEGTAALPALVNNVGTASAVNTSVGGAPQPGQAVNGRFAVAANITVPKYQAANLVATHNLTSTYVAPSRDDGGTIQTGLNDGPIQMPRTLANRDLRVLNPNGTSTGDRAITPYGYTVRMMTFIDYDNTGNLSTINRSQTVVTGQVPNGSVTVNQVGTVFKAYREFELAFGVPADMSMKVVESEIDLGKLGHSFGIQNGLLGYTGAGNVAFQPGFLPTPLVNNALLGSNGGSYQQFFKKFTVQNTGNVNFWNLRASQRTEVNGGTNYQWGSGNTFAYFGLHATAIDPRYGILAVGADPLNSLLGQNNLTPLVVTSLDRQYDAAWDNFIQNDGTYAPPYVLPIGADPSPYARYYAQLAARHTLHKPRVGVQNAATLGIPDVPGNQALRPVDQPQPQGIETTVGVAVPIGTPSGEYNSRLSNIPLVIFEDHDTDAGFNALPFQSGGNLGQIAAAGAFYAGSQVRPPGANAIRSFGGGNGEGIWRARRFVEDPANPGTVLGIERQPATNPGINLKLTVTESPLTGDIADRGIDPGNGGVAPNIVTGRLPGVDFFPLIDRSSVMRSAAALSPAAYRTPNGWLHVYFSRNFGGDLGAPFAQPGQPFKMFHSSLVWNPALGTFVASTSGSPLANSITGAATALNNQGKWFTNPTEVAPGLAANESNVSPYVLQTPAGATLFWINAQPLPNGQPFNQIFFAPLDPATGVPGGSQQLFTRPDASVQRFSPRALYDGQNAYVFYYGGSSGRWGLYYVSRGADANGTPTGNAPDATATGGVPIERPLSIPNSIASASDPTPVLRTIMVPNPNGGLQQVNAIDLYYTGISRATQTPDVYMTRFQLAAGRRGGVLTPMRLPKVFRERLVAPGRDPIYQSRHIGWFRTLTNANIPILPVIYIGPDANTANPVATADRWQVDSSTGVLFQSFGTGANETIVYVDAAAGTVRFRGKGAPKGSQYVFADYLPQTYRITVGGVSNISPIGFTDSREILPTTSFQSSNVVIRRTQPLTNRFAPLPTGGIGRHWLFWQRGAEGNRPPTLFFSARRIGIDLKDPSTVGGRLPASGTIQLSPRDANGNQVPVIGSVNVAGVGAVPYEADYISGRIYVEPQFEGLEVEVNYSQTQTGQPNGIARTASGVLSYIDELAPTGQGTTGIQAPISRSVNEGLPYAFLDTVDVFTSVSRTNPSKGTINNIADPTLLPGRIWLFWSSPRGRMGNQLINGEDAFPGGFDLYWQTLAPLLDPLVPSIQR